MSETLEFEVKLKKNDSDFNKTADEFGERIARGLQSALGKLGLGDLKPIEGVGGTQAGGEGPDNRAGDKGQLDGDPYAPSYFGGSGPGKGGVGYGLNGRGSASFKKYEQQCNEYGLVVVKIEVNRQGNVVKAEPGVRGTTNTDPCLLEPAKKIALSHKWPTDSNAPERQIGFVSINFDISQ